MSHSSTFNKIQVLRYLYTGETRHITLSYDNQRKSTEPQQQCYVQEGVTLHVDVFVST